MTPQSRPTAAGSGREWMLVGAAWLAVVLVAAVWLALDRRPPEWDHANHLERAVHCAEDLRTGDWRAILARSSFYPPVVPCAAALTYLIAPSDLAAAQTVILLFFGVAIAATYLLGRTLGDGTTGVAAAWILASAPFAVFSALRFQLDLPLAAAVALGLLALLRADGFRHRGASVVAGLVFGVGMLVKPSFGAYLLFPALWVLARAFGRRTLINAGLAVLVAALVSLPWYGPRLAGMPRQIAFRAVTHAAEEGKPETLSSAALAYYPTWLAPQLGVLAVALLAAGLVIALARRRGLAVVAFVAPFAVFTLLRNKDLRYTLPLLPMAAVLAGMAVAALGARARAAALGLLAVVGAVQVTGVAFGVPPAVTLPALGVPWLLGSAPMRGDWRHRDVLRVIERDRGGAPATVSVVPNDNFFSVSNFRYYAVRDGLPLRLRRPWDGEPLGIRYMVLKTGDQGPDFSEAKSLRVMQRLERDAALARAYPVIAEFPLPDGSMGSVRARRLLEPVATPPEALAQALERGIRRQLADVARDVDGLSVRLTYDAAIARGSLTRVELSARTATLGELRRRGAATLRVHDLVMIADDVLVNPYALEHERAALLDVGRLRLARAEIAADDLRTFLAGLKGFQHAKVALVAGAVDVTVEQRGPDVSARVRIVPVAGRPFGLGMDRVRLGGVPLPRALVDWVVRHYDPTPAMASRLPFTVEVGRVTITEQAIRIDE
ncbi:MAG TPA: glycosyltransferase family 39 protein [Methylomirabilota bacterium]|nr:glycosyltransferase family 39 protein [Methylomirabilota bacterium]